MHEAEIWYNKIRGEKAAEALKKNGFDAVFFNTKEDAAPKILDAIPKDAKVAVGGSMTIRELGLIERLAARGNKVTHHWIPGLTPDEDLRLRKEQIISDVFLSSSNAITLKGALINTDAVGNRICAMTFGPKKVIIIAGINKIVDTIDDGLKRIKVVSPMNNKRLGLDLPCVKQGKCVDCNEPNRSCRVTTIMERRPSKTDISVFIIGEKLGF